MKTNPFTTVNGTKKPTIGMAEVFRYGLMVLDMRVTGKAIELI